MKHLIVVAHPRANSFTHAVVATYAATLAGRGHRVACRDLHALEFDPVLSARDLAALAHGRAAKDIRAEQAALRRADVLSLVSPLWWSGFPAMLKGYIDRVFSEPFLPALAGKRGVIITIAGASAACKPSVALSGAASRSAPAQVEPQSAAPPKRGRRI